MQQKRRAGSLQHLILRQSILMIQMLILGRILLPRLPWLPRRLETTTFQRSRSNLRRQCHQIVGTQMQGLHLRNSSLTQMDPCIDLQQKLNQKNQQEPQHRNQ